MLSLAFSAVTLLPILDMSGYVPGVNQQPESALWTLTLLYAALPLGMKGAALSLLTLTSLSSEAHIKV